MVPSDRSVEQQRRTVLKNETQDKIPECCTPIAIKDAQIGDSIDQSPFNQRLRVASIDSIQSTRNIPMDPDIARPVWAEDLCNIITSIETRLFNKKALDQETMSQIEVIRPRLQCLKINPNVLLYHYERFYRESEMRQNTEKATPKMFYESFYNDCTTWIARVNYGTDDRLSVDAMAWWVLILQEGDFEPCQEELEILETLRVRGVRP